MANIVIQEINEQKLLDRMKSESCADCIDSTNAVIINLFGGLSICAERGKLTEAEIKSPLCCKIFVLLLMNRKRGMSARELSDHLWSDKDYENPTRNLRSLLFRLRATLRMITDVDLIVTTTNGYRLNPDVVIKTDFEEFEKICENRDKPMPGYQEEFLDIINEYGEKDRLLLLHINASVDQIIRTTNDSTFLRIGDKTRELKGADLRNLEYSKNTRHYEDECNTDAEIEDLDEKLIADYKHRIGADDLPTENDHSVTLILKNNIEQRHVKEEISAKSGRENGRDSGRDFDVVVEKILSEIKHNDKISVAQIAKNIGVSERTVGRHIKKLKENKLLTREGTKNGKWIILK